MQGQILIGEIAMPAITQIQLENASRDALDLALVVNGPADRPNPTGPSGTVTTRLGGDVPTLAKVLADLAGHDLIAAGLYVYGFTDRQAALLIASLSIEADFTESEYRNEFSQSNAYSSFLTYSRESPATAPDASGALQRFDAGVPRITNDGLRIEPPSSNTARPSADFSNNLWNRTGVVLSQAAPGPIGPMTRVTATSAGFHFVGQAMDAVGTVSAYVRAAGIRRVGIQIESGGSTKKAVYDLISGAVISADAGVTAWVDPGPAGTFRIVASVANAGAATTRIHALSDDNSDAFPTDGSKGFDLSAVQAEPGGLVTGYIETGNLPASRAIDAAFVPFAPSAEFAIFADASFRRAEGQENYVFSLIGDDPNNRVAILRNAGGRIVLEVVDGGVVSRAVGPIKASGVLRVAVSCQAGEVYAVIDGGTTLRLAMSRPAGLATLWLGIRGTAEAALNGVVRRILAVKRNLTKGDLSIMTAFPRALTQGGDEGDVRQLLIAHSNDRQPHSLPDTNRAVAEADSKTGLWGVAATDAFTGTDGTPLGNTETGGFVWVNTNGIQRIGGRAKQPAGAFSGAAIDTTFSDGQIEADLSPGTGEASLVFRSNTNFNQYLLLQRGGDGTVRLAYVFATTELIAPLINLTVVANERWKVRFVGSTIFVYRIVGGVETLIFNATETRLITNVRHGLRLNGTGTVDNFRILKREGL